MRIRTFTMISIGLLSAACQAPDGQNATYSPAVASQALSGDQLDNRYDNAQGNRGEASGRIIPMRVSRD